MKAFDYHTVRNLQQSVSLEDLKKAVEYKKVIAEVEKLERWSDISDLMLQRAVGNGLCYWLSKKATSVLYYVKLESFNFKTNSSGHIAPTPYDVRTKSEVIKALQCRVELAEKLIEIHKTRFKPTI